MDILYAKLQDHLKDGLTKMELRWIDWDFGQLTKTKPPVSWPCCLIDFPAVNYSDEGALIQLGDTQISLRFGFKVYERATSATGTIYRDQAVEHLQLLKKIHKLLQGWEDEHFAPLTRKAFQRVKRSDIREYVMIYDTVIYDDSGRKTLKKVARPTLEIES